MLIIALWFSWVFETVASQLDTDPFLITIMLGAIFMQGRYSQICSINFSFIQGGRGHWTEKYTCTQIFIHMFAYKL